MAAMGSGRPLSQAEDNAASNSAKPRRATSYSKLPSGMSASSTQASESAIARRSNTKRPARLGPSPGFSNLKWLKPVYAGDTITYRTTVTAKRPSASRPGWGLVFHHNTGTNQHGEEVFAFDGMVFWERRV